MSAGIQLALHVTRRGGGGQLTTQQPSKAPLRLSAKARVFLLLRTKECDGNVSQDIRSFHDFQNIYTRNIWILMCTLSLIGLM